MESSLASCGSLAEGEDTRERHDETDGDRGNRQRGKVHIRVATDLEQPIQILRLELTLLLDGRVSPQGKWRIPTLGFTLVMLDAPLRVSPSTRSKRRAKQWQWVCNFTFMAQLVKSLELALLELPPVSLV